MINTRNKFLIGLATYSLFLIPYSAFANLAPESMPWVQPGGIMEQINPARYDTSDPMFFERPGDFVSRTSIISGNHAFAVSQEFSYGTGENLSIAGNIFARGGYDNNRSITNIGLGFTYRTAQDGDFVTDFFGGINHSPIRAVPLPYYSSAIYTLGARIGQQRERMTIAGTVQTHWLFDSADGKAFIDFVPEVYFRVANGWAVGAHFALRQATNHDNQRYIGTKVTRRFGRTMYVGGFDYEFRTGERKFSGHLVLLF